MRRRGRMELGLGLIELKLLDKCQSTKDQIL